MTIEQIMRSLANALYRESADQSDVVIELSDRHADALVHELVRNAHTVEAIRGLRPPDVAVFHAATRIRVRRQQGGQP